MSVWVLIPLLPISKNLPETIIWDQRHKCALILDWKVFLVLRLSPQISKKDFALLSTQYNWTLKNVYILPIASYLPHTFTVAPVIHVVSPGGQEMQLSSLTVSLKVSSTQGTHGDARVPSLRKCPFLQSETDIERVMKSRNCSTVVKEKDRYGRQKQFFPTGLKFWSIDSSFACNRVSCESRVTYSRC